MNWYLPNSLQARLALTIGVGVGVLWIITALITTTIIREEINEVFDSSLEATRSASCHLPFRVCLNAKTMVPLS